MLDSVLRLVFNNREVLSKNFANSLFYMGGTILQLAIALVTMPIYAKYLRAEDFAIIGYYHSVQMFLFPLFQLNLTSYYVAYYYSLEEQGREGALSKELGILNISNVLTALAGLILIGIYFRLANVSIPLFPYIFIIIFYLFFDKFKTFVLIDCRIRKKGLLFFLFSVCAVFLNAAFSLALVVLIRAGAIGKMAGPMISTFVISIIAILYLVKQGRFKVKNNITRLDIVNRLKFCWPLILAGYAYFPIGNLDKILLERLHDLPTLGIYSIGITVAGFVNIFFIAMYQSFEPDLFKMVIEKRRKKFALFSAAYVSVMVFAAAIFVTFSKVLISILTGGRYVLASQYANAAVIGSVFSSTGGLLLVVFLANKATVYNLYNDISVGLFSIMAYFCFIRWKGFQGAISARICIGMFYIVSIVVLYYIYKHRKKSGKLLLESNA